MSTILLTGAAGYIGSVLTNYLLRAGHDVIGVDSLLYGNGSALLPHLGDPRFTFLKMSVDERSRMRSLVQGADIIIPLAALVGAPVCEKNPLAAKNWNYGAIRDMVKDARKDTRIIYPNTNSGYGATDGAHYCTEDEPLNPVSVYGRTKCDAEKAVLDHPDSTVFRLATVFGDSPRMRMDLMVNDFTHQLYDLKHGSSIKPMSLFEPHFVRNFVHVRDVCRAFQFAAQPPQPKIIVDGKPCGSVYAIPPGIYNLGLPEANLTKMQLAHLICERLRLTKDVVTIGEGRDIDQRNYLVSNERILSTGFEFQHSLEDGIGEVISICATTGASALKTMRNA